MATTLGARGVRGPAVATPSLLSSTAARAGTPVVAQIKSKAASSMRCVKKKIGFLFSLGFRRAVAVPYELAFVDL